MITPHTIQNPRLQAYDIALEIKEKQFTAQNFFWKTIDQFYNTSSTIVHLNAITSLISSYNLRFTAQRRADPKTTNQDNSKSLKSETLDEWSLTWKLGFFEKDSPHLDRKTRAFLSVGTKVKSCGRFGLWEQRKERGKQNPSVYIEG